ncbi:DUF6090 family protein [Cryomorphaceae bacterium 1068]|nr:DUF6090 family protein [Cryomorphaceae bacterium 1068]
MIKFFRHIRQRMIKESRFSKYMLYAIGEIVLVVIGILIALQINNWNEQKKELKTVTVLANSLKEDLNKDVEFLQGALEFSQKKISSCDTLLALLSVPQENWDVEGIYRSLNTAGQSNPFFPTTGTYKQIVTSGSLKLFDQSIANQLNGYDMQLQKLAYWTDAEDKTLWLIADIAWKGMSMQAIADIRFNHVQTRELIMDIPPASVNEFINLTSAIKTYRTKAEMEYRKQLSLADDLIDSLNETYDLKER